MAEYVKIRSWHRISLTYRSGLVHTRCGRDVIVAGTIMPSEFPTAATRHETSDELPMGERSCESCLRGLVLDDERRASNDPIESGPADDAPVPA